MRTLPLVLLLACHRGETEDRADEGDTDTDADADADSDSDADSDADTDSTPTGPWLTARPANPTCLAAERPVPSGGVELVRAYPALSFDKAVQAIQPPDDPDTWWVLEQDGRVLSFHDDPGVSATSVVLDITGRVDSSGNEMGLLSLAFHPQWSTNHEVVVSYTTGPSVRSIVSRFRSDDGGRTLDPASEEQLLAQDQPFTNHNGGLVLFGPDGYLYLGFGDGGSGGDPYGNGQDLDVLLGKMLRIDVDHGSPYAIPPDNPFAGGGGRPEIYAWGLRNPWRYSFDAATGDLWVGDVGQDLIEEIDVVRRGGNYGWNTMEGDRCYAAPGCDTTSLELPVATMHHDEGHRSVTGGLVYRGTRIPDLVGRYVWADYQSGQIFSLGDDPLTGDPVRVDLLPTGISPTHVGADADGELVFVSRNAGLYRLVPAGNPGPSTFPERLDLTGCFDAAGEPLPMMVPYEVAHPFWSDGADKERFLAIPDGTSLTTDADGRVVFPVGSVLTKQFRLSGRTIETRLLMLHDDGNWAGYAYAWDEAGTTATLLPGAQTVRGGAGEEWRVPSRSECLRCHNLDVDQTLGPRLEQLDVEATQPNGWVENQVDELVRLGMMTAPAERPGALAALEGTAPLEERARTWLHVNCSFCHLPGGSGGGTLDLRLETPLSATGMCDAPTQGDLGLPSARIVAPGDPSSSVLSSRIGRRDVHQMPPLGTSVVDAVGSGVVDQWISGLSSCP